MPQHSQPVAAEFPISAQAQGESPGGEGPGSGRPLSSGRAPADLGNRAAGTAPAEPQNAHDDPAGGKTRRDDDAITEQLKKAVEVCTAKVQQARDDLVEALERQYELAKSKSPKSKRALISTIADDIRAFKEDGVLPDDWNLQIEKANQNYTRTLTKARDTCSQGY